MNKILSKVIVAQFYRMNAGFFLTLFILLFGLLDGKSTLQLHYGIMRYITRSYEGAIGAAVIWLLYSFKCLRFVLRELGSSSNNFLFAAQAFDDKRQFRGWLLCLVALMLPLLVYGSIAGIVGIANGQYMLTGIFALFQMGLCLGCAAFVFRHVNATWLPPIVALPPLFRVSRRRFAFYLLHYSVETKKSMLFSSKILSMLLLQAMIAVNYNELNKESVCVLLMFIISTHAIFPIHYVRFMEGHLSFLRNLPIKVLAVFGVYALTYAIIFLPELLFLLVNAQRVLPMQLIGSIYAVAVCQMLFYTSLLYLPKVSIERYTAIVSIVFFSALLFLAASNLWVMAIIFSFFSILIYLKQKNHYENLNS